MATNELGSHKSTRKSEVAIEKCWRGIDGIQLARLEPEKRWWRKSMKERVSRN